MADDTSARLSNVEAEGEAFLFVPALAGALRTHAGVAARQVSVLETTIPESALTFEIGYRRYLDDFGRTTFGGSLGGSTSLPNRGRRAGGRLSHLGGVLELQHRFMSPTFIYFLLGVFGEAGVTHWSADGGDLDPALVPDSGLGYRVSAGVELGFGMLGWLDPYIFGEMPVYFAYEQMTAGGVNIASFQFGVRLTVDFIHR